MNFLLVAQAITTAHRQQMAANHVDLPTLINIGLEAMDRQTHDPDACDVPACPRCQELARDRAMEMKGDLRRGT